MKIGEVIDGRYRLEELLSRHHAGLVFRAVTVGAAEPVIVRLFDAPSGAAAEGIAAVLDAAQALDHPGLVRVLDGGWHGDAPYLVTGVPAGNPLTRELALAPLAMARVIHIGHEIALLLAHLHRQGLVHGDLRPANVILVPTPDFPIVRLTGFGPVVSSAAPAAGEDRAYRAPELAAGGLAGARSDLYALGAILYGLSTGRSPTTDAPAPAQINRTVPDALDALVGRLLSPTPDERPSDAAAVAARLAEIGQNDHRPPSRPPGPPTPPG